MSFLEHLRRALEREAVRCADVGALRQFLASGARAWERDVADPPISLCESSAALAAALARVAKEYPDYAVDPGERCRKGLCDEPAVRLASYRSQGRVVAIWPSCPDHGGEPFYALDRFESDFDLGHEVGRLSEGGAPRQPLGVAR